MKRSPTNNNATATPHAATGPEARVTEERECRDREGQDHVAGLASNKWRHQHSRRVEPSMSALISQTVSSGAAGGGVESAMIPARSPEAEMRGERRGAGVGRSGGWLLQPRLHLLSGLAGRALRRSQRHQLTLEYLHVRQRALASDLRAHHLGERTLITCVISASCCSASGSSLEALHAVVLLLHLAANVTHRLDPRGAGALARHIVALSVELPAAPGREANTSLLRAT